MAWRPTGPAALADLPRSTRPIAAGRTGGDLSVQACADDPLVAFHAVRQLARLASGVANAVGADRLHIRPADGRTPRNLMGFKDGTQTPAAVDKVVWIADDGPAWMRGGSFMVVRRIRMALEHWTAPMSASRANRRTGEIVRRAAGSAG